MTTPFTRDLDTGGEDGPELTASESESARDMEAPGLVNPPEDQGGGGEGGGMAEALHQRPKFSPVAQPGMVEEIHWHTVKTEQREPGPPAGGRGRGKGKGRRRGHRKGKGRHHG